mmetsp:Transcript_66014/g.143878  ORF Transcript_66014/g.143878 Transcript_66014/m.143878 type:complete len:338 (+) Transcript_66014:1624-2637(+)
MASRHRRIELADGRVAAEKLSTSRCTRPAPRVSGKRQAAQVSTELVDLRSVHQCEDDVQHGDLRLERRPELHELRQRRQAEATRGHRRAALPVQGIPEAQRGMHEGLHGSPPVNKRCECLVEDAKVSVELLCTLGPSGLEYQATKAGVDARQRGDRVHQLMLQRGIAAAERQDAVLLDQSGYRVAGLRMGGNHILERLHNLRRESALKQSQSKLSHQVRSARSSVLHSEALHHDAEAPQRPLVQQPPLLQLRHSGQLTSCPVASCFGILLLLAAAASRDEALRHFWGRSRTEPILQLCCSQLRHCAGTLEDRGDAGHLGDLELLKDPFGLQQLSQWT